MIRGGVMRFFLFSVSVFLLTLSVFLACQIFEPGTVAQAPEPLSGWLVEDANISNVRHFIMLSNGDMYIRRMSSAGIWAGDAPTFAGNFWGSTPSGVVTQ